MGVEHVVYCAVYVARYVVVVLLAVEVALMRSVCLRVYGMMVVPPAL